MTWNTLCISSRVITLALFASQEQYWFAGIVIVHLLIALVIYGLLIRGLGDYEPLSLLSISLAVTSIFNIGLTYERRFRNYVLYVCYWIVMMIENTILIGIWYTLSTNDGLWYHNPAIAYVMTAYFISFFIKTYQTYQRKDKNKEPINVGKPLLEWIC